MRRRSASALSTAAVRLVSSLVTWAAWTCLGARPEQALARASSRRATPIVTHGATNTSADDADERGQPRPAAGA